MTFKYDAAGALARIKAGLSQRAEDRKPEGTPANPAKAGSAAQGGLAGLAGLAGVPVDFHAGDHTTKAVSSPIEDQKSARTPAKVAKAANPFPATPLAAGPEDDVLPDGSAPIPADTVAVVLRQPTPPWDSEDWLAFYGEKAGIGEYDHGLSRPEAEKRAFNCCVAEWLYRHPVSSNADDGCAICGKADRPNDDLLPVRLGGGLSWLHRECVPAWRAARMAEAGAGLATMGITSTGSSP